MIFRTWPVYFGTVTVAWDAVHETFYARGSNSSGQRIWEYGTGMPTVGALRAVLLGHRVTMHVTEATHLLTDMRTARASRTAS
jgi:hypothetical protein